SVISFQEFENTPTCLAVSVWVMSLRHLLIQRSVIKQLLHRRHNHLCIRSNKLDCTRLNRFRALSSITHNQNRLTQTRRLFLHTTAVGQHQTSLLHQENERLITQGLDQMYITGTTQQTLHRFLNVGVEMYGINEVGIRVRLCKSAQRLTDILETLTEVLPSMPGYKNVFLAQHSRVKPRLSQRGLHLHSQFS